jgi:hypothetical protein
VRRQQPPADERVGAGDVAPPDSGAHEDLERQPGRHQRPVAMLRETRDGAPGGLDVGRRDLAADD